MSPSWVLQVLLVLLASLEPLGSDVLVPEAPPALLDSQDKHMNQV